MLGRKSYAGKYVSACRARLDAQLAAHAKIQSTPAFDRELFANLVLALEMSFVHRLRGVEGKDGNALNEVRMLSTSILEHDAVLTADNTIKYDPAKSVLGFRIGDRIAIDADGFRRLAKAFFAELTKKFT